ncbi:MAG: protease-like activity factor CPAF [Elusimicrobia bacterium]|nr:protease-like activity factor CPAF [Elusimicrobiota bacterium]MDE2424877.1 protease-like activity factor CPAF [Elusimicrobiota bacterium]
MVKILLPLFLLLAFPFARPARAVSDEQQRLNRFFDHNLRGAGETPAVVAMLPQAKPRTSREMRQAMLSNLEFIRSCFSAQYGPGQWKEAHESWDLDREIDKAEQAVRSHPGMTLSQYHEILRDFFNSMKDYHVEVFFNSTEASSLPFTVVGAGGRYFIGWIDRDKLPESSFPFHVGDELTGFGGLSAAQAVKGLQARLGGNTAQTDRALASLYLTHRNAAGFGDVDRGPITLTFMPKGSKKSVSRQLIWDYTPEAVVQPKTEAGLMLGELADAGDPTGLGLALAAAPKAQHRALPSPWLDNMLSPIKEAMGQANAGNPYGLGAKESPLPGLGVKIWESGGDSLFNAYIYRSPAGRLIGCVRIPDYEPDDVDASAAAFAALMTSFQKKTDALVIDQLNNPGGSVFYLYALASMLSDQPLAAPRHRIALTPSDVQEAAKFLKKEPLVHNDADAIKQLGMSYDGYPVSYELFQHIVEYSRFILAQWKAGHTLTDPIFLYGVDQINPSTVARYDKPILLLVNQLDFSGADFFPAIMQDNRRATIFGTRTSGAGGFVREIDYPNSVGVANFHMTGSIALRASKKPIENLGVTPDVPYAVTPADLQNGYKDYIKAVNAQIEKMLRGQSLVR